MKPFLLIERRAEGQHHLHAATSHVSPGSTATEHLHQARVPRVYKRDGHLRTAKYDREHPHVGDHDHRRHGDDAEQEAKSSGGQGGQQARSSGGQGAHRSGGQRDLHELPDVHQPRPRVGAQPDISGDRTAPGPADGEGHRQSTPRV